MTYCDFGLEHPKDEAAAAFVSKVGQALQRALVERKALEKLTQREIADRLGVDRSRVNRCFSGSSNLSLEALAELCWAMDVEPNITLTQILGDRSCNIPHTHTERPSSVPPSSLAASVVTGTGAVRATETSAVRNRAEFRYAG